MSAAALIDSLEFARADLELRGSCRVAELSRLTDTLFDTQGTLPFGSPDEVRAQVRERLKIFGKDGGFIFNPIHNVQAMVPVENLLAMYETVREYGSY